MGLEMLYEENFLSCENHILFEKVMTKNLFSGLSHFLGVLLLT